jgi:hypothetical protein
MIQITLREKAINLAKELNCEPEFIAYLKTATISQLKIRYQSLRFINLY